MRTWKLPMAIGQKFAANEYVAACYSVKCWAPNENGWCSDLYDDANGNGIFDEGESIANPPYVGAAFKGCGGYHTVKGEAKPESLNGFVIQGEDHIPVFYWIGDVLDPTEEGDMADFHFTDSLANIEDYGNAS